MVEIKKIDLFRDNSNVSNKSESKTIKPVFNVKDTVLSNYESKEIILKKFNLKKEEKLDVVDSSKKQPKSVSSNLKKDKIKTDNLNDESFLVIAEKNNDAKNQKERELNNEIEDDLSYRIEKRKLELVSQQVAKDGFNNYDLDTVSKDTEINLDELLGDLDKQTKNVDDDKPFIEMISFLDDEPKISKIKINNLDISNLYSKIDDIGNKNNTKVIQTEYVNQNKIKEKESKIKEKHIDIFPLIEKIEIPDIVSLNDDTKIVEALNDKFVSLEKKPDLEKPKASSFVVDDKKLKPNPLVEEKIKNLKIHADKLKIEVASKIKEENLDKNLKRPINSFDYILPKDYGVTNQEKKAMTNKDKSLVSLIYDAYVNVNTLDKKEIREKYNVDEFTFVDVSFVDNKLLYNIIQPELTKAQEEIYLDVKKSFLDSIDANYYSFNGDKQGINSYIKKIFDLTLDKLSFDLTNLDKKLYFNFIKQEFSGLGFLYSVLDDKNVIEINCAGVGLPITVYHIKYGAIETNLKFEKMSQLNLYVLALTKVMGIRVNSSNPLINGYLPNGYKVEGIYSVGDTSNKGSSFVIKKYLENPLTPVSLINLGIGAIDIFSYIWCGIDQGYQIILTGTDNVLIMNSLAQLYPNKKITSVQSYDYLKFPQKNWIKRLVLENSQISKKAMISQTFSERPDYLVLDTFTPDLFDTKWYDINMIYVNPNVLQEYLEKIKSIGLDAIVIYLDRIKSQNFEQIQISKVIEIQKSILKTILEYNSKGNYFHVNLVPSSIDIVEFKRKQKVLRWMVDSDILDYFDFNNIVSDYNTSASKLFSKLNINEKE